ncbi:MAG TPA: ATP-dependent helicase HrpB, partial [Chromatiales bacterium]|nr:ATP-dependent helicase HrpB [Chromatiales bacterium]
TSIAETSLTIEGITLVVDTGLERRSLMNPLTGMASLETVTASMASADQRRGRAGRLAPGHCYRLWAKEENSNRPVFSTPEIALTDLAPLVLELAQWGVSNQTMLTWLTPPPEKAWAQATRLLQSLEIIDEKRRLTRHGQALATLGLSPRLGHMLVTANRLGSGGLACDIAAFLMERSPFQNHHAEVDFSARLRLLQAGSHPNGVNRSTLSRVRKQSRAWRGRLKPLTDTSQLSIGAICALAFPDRIGKARSASGLDYKLSGGGAAAFTAPNPLSGEPWLVITELDGRTHEARIFTAVSITLDEIETLFESRLVHENQLHWDRQQQAIVSRNVTLLGEIVLREQPAEMPAGEETVDIMLQVIRKLGLSCLPWTKAANDWLERLRFLHHIQSDRTTLPDFSETALLETLDEWLGPWLSGISKRSQLANLDLKAILKSRLSWEQQQSIDKLAPTHLTVPSGSRIRLQYDGERPPVLAVRIQEMFSATDSPTIADGQVRVQLQLLSPARRPVQITSDLAGFWSGSYQEVKKEMKGRYPKHHWPEDPINTRPHATVKPR